MKACETQREGFVLPVVIFTMAILGLVAVAALTTANDERLASRGLRQSGAALYAAEAGVNLITRTVVDSPKTVLDTLAANLAAGDSVDLGWTSLPGDATYRGVFHRYDNGGKAMYLLGVTGRGSGYWGGEQVINVMLTSGGGVSLPITAAIRGGYGSTGEIEDNNALTGIDAHPPGWSSQCSEPLVDVPGIVWQNGGLDIDDPQGNPPYVVDPTIDSTNLWELGGTTYDDLAAMANITMGSYSGSPNPTLSGADCDTSDPTNWGAPEDAGHACRDYFPIIHLTGSANMSGGSGQGILLIDGNSDWDGGSFTFYGILMIKGTIDEWDDGPGVYGAVIAAGIDRIRDGSHIRYSSCVVARALALAGPGVGGSGGLLRPIGRRSWSAPLR